ncbi:MAG: hypothetical protein IPP11_07405 [Chitinophagaceae bacterium]|nr:hypothetical protein [Chitinophagaceae bacterium]
MMRKSAGLLAMNLLKQTFAVLKYLPAIVDEENNFIHNPARFTEMKKVKSKMGKTHLGSIKTFNK